jgi:hypothetical protein
VLRNGARIHGNEVHAKLHALRPAVGVDGCTDAAAISHPYSCYYEHYCLCGFGFQLRLLGEQWSMRWLCNAHVCIHDIAVQAELYFLCDSDNSAAYACDACVDYCVRRLGLELRGMGAQR